MTAEPTRDCPDDDVLALFVGGGLDAASEDRVRSHLAACGSCRKLVAAASHDPFAQTDVSSQPPAFPANKYALEEQLGSGGMGLVYRARHLALQRVVAIKLLHPHLLEDATVRRRFEREARATAALRSPHVVRILDIDWLPTGEPFIVMEYLEGCDLAVLLDRDGPLPPDRAVAYVREACEALSEAHGKGIIHRDIKPQNLFLARDGDANLVKVLDFGLAKVVRGQRPIMAGSDSLALTGAMLGSPYYMSPEQIRSTDIDARTDVWSMGATLYTLLCGQAPFVGPNLKILCARILTGEPRPMSKHGVRVPPALEEIVKKCLRVSPDERWPTIDAMATALATASGSAEIARATTTTTTRPRSPRAAAAALVIVASAGALWALHDRAKPPAPVASEPVASAPVASAPVASAPVSPSVSAADSPAAVLTTPASIAPPVETKPIASITAITASKVVAPRPRPARSGAPSVTAPTSVPSAPSKPALDPFSLPRTP